MAPAVLDRPEVRFALFHPRPEYGLVWDDPRVRPIRVEVAPGIAVGGRLYPAGAEAPVILYFHGNGEIAAEYDGLAPLYTRMGITLAVMDYRGYGASDGVPTAQALLADAVAAFDALGSVCAGHGLAPARRYVMGRSLGSAAAIEVAARAGEALAGLIIESGFADTFGLLARLGVPVRDAADEDRDGFGNGERIARVTAPTLVIHGAADVLIPPGDGRALYERSAAGEKRLVLIPHAGHNDLMLVGPQAYFEAVRAFVLA